jgi:glutathione synthase/RimK-type ligase-like ATP-grasp enzyme
VSTIIIHAAVDDVHARAVAGHVRRAGSEALVVDREACFDLWAVSCLDDGVFLTIGDRLVAGADVAAVLWRRDFLVEPGWIASQHEVDPAAARFLAEQRAMHVESAFKRLAASCPFVNDISSNRRASSKVLQQTVARRCGLRVPATYVGSDPRQAEAFAQALWNGGSRCCTKNIESTHVTVDGVPHARFTRLFTADDLPELSGLPVCPLIFQRYVEKRCEYRVTIVGQEIFACRIESQAAGGQTAVDWRHYDIPATPHFAAGLPEAVSHGLVRLMRELGLAYGAIDLVEDPHGEIWFLEVNSMGQWLWIEDLTELPISAALASYLLQMGSRG